MAKTKKVKVKNKNKSDNMSLAILEEWILSHTATDVRVKKMENNMDFDRMLDEALHKAEHKLWRLGKLARITVDLDNSKIHYDYWHSGNHRTCGSSVLTPLVIEEARKRRSLGFYIEIAEHVNLEDMAIDEVNETFMNRINASLFDTGNLETDGRKLWTEYMQRTVRALINDKIEEYKRSGMRDYEFI